MAQVSFHEIENSVEGSLYLESFLLHISDGQARDIDQFLGFLAFAHFTGRLHLCAFSLDAYQDHFLLFVRSFPFDGLYPSLEVDSFSRE